MSTMHEDPLYQVFEEHLHSGVYDQTPVEQFVRDVVETYLTKLNQRGYVPQKLQEPLRADLLLDVQEMLKAKTYGHYGIGEYNRLRRQKTS